MRLIEYGDVPFIRDAFPEQTEFFASGLKSGNVSALAAARRLAAAVRDPETSLVICHSTAFPPWHWQWLSRHLFARRIASRGLPFLGATAGRILPLVSSRPIAVLDFSDSSTIESSNVSLLDRCTLYFKRELPVDGWKVFQGTAHRSSPTPRFRSSARQIDRLAKLRPLSLGLPAATAQLLPVTPRQKKHDLFFAGQVSGSSTVRQRGMHELAALRSAGLSVDTPEQRLPAEEFYRRCAEAWIVWSPEGLGWDCFRHYEALACGSVPVINQPTIQRHMPLIEGKHALYYEPYEGELARVITSALLDKDRLAAIAEAGRQHVMRHHTSAAIAGYVVDTTQAAAGLTP